jgi:hypothetical protein
MIALCQHPRQRQLRRCAPFFSSQFGEMCNQLKIYLEVFALESRTVSPEIIRRKIFRRADLTG